MIRMPIILVALPFAFVGPALAQISAIEDIDAITLEVTNALAQGALSPEIYEVQLDALMQLRGQEMRGEGAIVERLAWADGPGAAIATAGTALEIVGVPDDAAGEVVAVHDNGHREVLDITLTDDGEVALILPARPADFDEGGRYTISVPGALGVLTAELQPVQRIEGAGAILGRLIAQGAVERVERAGEDPAELAGLVETAPSQIPPQLSADALLLAIWRAGGQGDPFFSILRTGVIDREAFPSVSDADQAVLDIILTSVLMNGLNPAALRGPPDILNRINDDAPYSPRARLWRASLGQPFPAPTIDDFTDIGPAIEQGRELAIHREVYLGAAKDTHKVIDFVANWGDPAVGAASVSIGAALTLVDQAMKAALHNFPADISLSARAGPSASMLADDSRPMVVDAAIGAHSKPYVAYAIQDGLDLALTGLALAASSYRGKFGNIEKAIEVGASPAGRALLAVDDIAGAKQFAVLKEVIERLEKRFQSSSKDGSQLPGSIKVPGKRWGPFPVTTENAEGYFRIVYNGAVRWRAGALTAQACWNGTNDAKAVIAAIPERFGGKHAKERVDWAVETPVISVSGVGSLEPGEIMSMSATVQGSEQQRAIFYDPEVGALVAVRPLSADYQAPTEVNGCRTLATVEVAYPSDNSRICAPSPRTHVPVVISDKGYGQIEVPAAVACTPGERRSWTVNHPDPGQPISCLLNGPARLSQSDRNLTLQCSERKGYTAAVQCFTGPAPNSCSPITTILPVDPDIGAHATVEVPGKPGQWDGPDVIDELGIGLEPSPDGRGGGMASHVAELRRRMGRLGRRIAISEAGDSGGARDGGAGSSDGGGAVADGRFRAKGYPLGEGRDLSVAHSGSADFRIPGESGTMRGNAIAAVAIDEDSNIEFQLEASLSVGREKTSSLSDYSYWRRTPVSAWAVAVRRVTVSAPSRIFVGMDTSGDGQASVLAQVGELYGPDRNWIRSIFGGFTGSPLPVLMAGDVGGFEAAPMRLNDPNLPRGFAEVGLDLSDMDAAGSIVVPGPLDGERTRDFFVILSAYGTPDLANQATASVSGRLQWQANVKIWAELLDRN